MDPDVAVSSNGAVSSNSAVDLLVERVLVVAKTHLDVGFTDLAAVVRRRYLDEFFPRAVAVAAELRERGGPARFRWTTGSWILTEALEAEARTGRHDVARAVEAGDLCWHALPFTTHTEYSERSLLEHGLSLSARLDERFGRRTVAAKMTDVPGHTRGLVSVLAGAGVEFLHIGVNPASSPPRVPQLFRWRDPAAHGAQAPLGVPEVLVMYQPGSYGDVQVLPGTDTAVAIDLTGDNLGPPSAADVVERWDALARRFPNATIEAATLDDVALRLQPLVAELPVVDAEIGDTWIQGVGTDPAKTAAFRALCRRRRSWLDDGLVAADDPTLARASTELLAVAEHTWGLDLKAHWPDEESWGAGDLRRRRGDPATARLEASWAEQREYLDRFGEELRRGGRDDLADDAAAARAATVPTEPFVDDLELLVDGVGRPVRVGDVEFAVAPDGGLAGLRIAGGDELATVDRPLGSLWVQTFDAADLERRYATYNGVTADEDQWWARWDNTKPGLERSGARSAVWRPSARHVWAGARGEMAVLVVELAFDVTVENPVAVPARAFLTVRVHHDDASVSGSTSRIEFDLQLFGVPAARWSAASWWSFAPAVGDPAAWSMSKLDEWVSPYDVVAGGARALHCADQLRHGPSGTELELIDTALVAPGGPRLLGWSDESPDLEAGWHVCLHDNIWGTNFPMWFEGDARFRVVLQRAARR